MANPMLFASVMNNDKDMVARLLEDDDASVNSRNGSGQTPLHVATSLSLTHMVSLLLSYGGDVSILTPPRFGGLSCLHIAARADSATMCQLLLRGGGAHADVNVRTDPQCSTPLMESAKFNATHCLIFLLSLPSIDASCVDAAGFSASYYARKNGCAPSILKLMPKHITYDTFAQLQSEPAYERNMASVQSVIDKKEAIKQKKLENAEKKKKKKF